VSESSALDGEASRRLRDGAKDILGRELSGQEVGAFEGYVDELVIWQRHTRLVGRADPIWIVDNLLLDSLLFLRFLPHQHGRVLDLGSGAGIPGVPLKIVAPSLSFCLVEGRRKRASFLASVVRRIGWRDVDVVGMRGEDAIRTGAIKAGSFDTVVSRCAGDAKGIVALGQALLQPYGALVISGPPATLRPSLQAERVLVPRSIAGGNRAFWVWRRAA